MQNALRPKRWFLASGWMDTVLRQRARIVLARSGLSDALPLSGLMLEVGAGTGHLTEAVMRRMPARRCVVADAASLPPPLLARRLARRDFHAIRAPTEALPFADSRFDAAWANFALRSLDSGAQRRALAELRRVVRPGGVLVLLETSAVLAWPALLGEHGWVVQQETAFSLPFAPTARDSQRRAFVCR